MTVQAPNEIHVPAAPNNYGGGGFQKIGFILHWMAGYLPGTDAMFQRASTGYCTNYGIGSRDGKGNGLEVHRYTPNDTYRAFGSYNADADNRGISIEIENNYWAGYASTPTPQVHELVATFMAAKADALRLGPLVLGDFPDHRFYLKPIPAFGRDFNVTTHRSMALKDCPGTTQVHWLVNRANQLRGHAQTPIIEPPLEEDDMAKNSGVFWKRADGVVEHMLFNTDSGFHVHHIGGNGTYNNALATSLGTDNWAPISESHAQNFIASLEATLQSKASGTVTVELPDPVEVDLDGLPDESEVAPQAVTR